MYCPVCGRDTVPEDVLCPRCGFELPPKQEKKILFLILPVFLAVVIGVLIFLLSQRSAPSVGIAADGSSPEIDIGPANRSSVQDIEVHRGDSTVTLTLPPAVAGENPPQELTEEQVMGGYQSVTVGRDGSVTYELASAAYRQLLADMAVDCKTALKGLPGKGAFLSVRSIAYTDDLKRMTVTVDRATFESIPDTGVAAEIFALVVSYHNYSGVPVSKLQITVEYLDEASGAVFHTAIYPDAFGETDSFSIINAVNKPD